jgi:hypothetical protein
MVWLDMVYPVFLTALIVYLPGLLVGVGLRLSLGKTIAFAPLATLLICVLPPIVLEPLFGVWWTLWTPALSALAAIAAAFIIGHFRFSPGAKFRLVIPRQFTPRAGFSQFGVPYLLTLALALSVFTIMIVGSVEAPWMVTNNYDTAFHLNATEHLFHVGRASSFTLRNQIMGSGFNFYPAAWHTFAAIVAQAGSIAVMPAFYAVLIVFCGMVWPVSLAYCARKFFGPNRTRELIVIGLSVMFSAFPYIIFDFGSLYPTLLSYCIAPVALGVGYQTLNALARNESFWRLLILFGVAETAVFFSQPRTVFLTLIVLLPFLVWKFKTIYLVQIASRGSRAKKIFFGSSAFIILVGAGMLFYVFRAIYGLSEPLENRLNGPQARPTNTIWESLFYMLSLTSRRSSGPLQTVDGLILALIIFSGVIIWFSKSNRWLIFAFLATGSLYVLASASSSNAAKILTALWYKDQRRLMAFLVIVAILLIGYGAGEIVEAITEQVAGFRIGRVRIIPGVFVAVLLVNALITPSAGEMRFRIWGTVRAHDFPSAQYPKPYLLSLSDYKVMEQLPNYMAAFGVRFIGDPWDGSTFAQGVTKRSAYFAALDGNWTTKQKTVLANWDVLDDYDQPAYTIAYYESIWDYPALQAQHADYQKYRVCRYLVEDGKVQFFLDFGESIDPNSQKAQRFKFLQVLDTGFEELYRSGDSAIYRITACDGWYNPEVAAL